jgi:hypothetical protein
MYKTVHAIMAALLLLNTALHVNAKPLKLEPPRIPTSIPKDINKLSNFEFTYTLELVMSNS